MVIGEFSTPVRVFAVVLLTELSNNSPQGFIKVHMVKIVKKRDTQKKDSGVLSWLLSWLRHGHVSLSPHVAKKEEEVVFGHFFLNNSFGSDCYLKLSDLY